MGSDLEARMGSDLEQLQALLGDRAKVIWRVHDEAQVDVADPEFVESVQRDISNWLKGLNRVSPIYVQPMPPGAEPIYWLREEEKEKP